MLRCQGPCGLSEFYTNALRQGKSSISVGIFHAQPPEKAVTGSGRRKRRLQYKVLYRNGAACVTMAPHRTVKTRTVNASLKERVNPDAKWHVGHKSGMGGQ
jgi:hypothetical protein